MADQKKKVNLANKPVPKKNDLSGKPVPKKTGVAEKSYASSKKTNDAAKAGASKKAYTAEKPASAPKKTEDAGKSAPAKSENKGKYTPKKAEYKPWDKMYAGKGGAKAAVAKKPAQGAKTAVDKKSTNPPKKPVKEMRDFLYLLPKKTTAKSLAGVLGFINKKDIEVWEEECVLEITTKEGVITFEDIRETLEKEDKEVLNDLRMKQVLSCDYESTDAETVRKVMDAFMKAFGGKIASDSKDFTPFLTLEDI